MLHIMMVILLVAAAWMPSAIAITEWAPVTRYFIYVSSTKITTVSPSNRAISPPPSIIHPSEATTTTPYSTSATTISKYSMTITSFFYRPSDITIKSLTQLPSKTTTNTRYFTPTILTAPTICSNTKWEHATLEVAIIPVLVEGQVTPIATWGTETQAPAVVNVIERVEVVSVVLGLGAVPVTEPGGRDFGEGCMTVNGTPGCAAWQFYGGKEKVECASPTPVDKTVESLLVLATGTGTGSGGSGGSGRGEGEEKTDEKDSAAVGKVTVALRGVVVGFLGIVMVL